MAIRINIVDSHPNLFCDSKWWGDPELPEDLKYPMVEGVPMTFITQLSLYDLSKFDSDGLLPQEGMFYFFADLDEFIDEAPESVIELPRSSFAVRYTKTVNMETFATVQLMDEDDEPIAPAAYPVEFEQVADDAEGTVILGTKLPETIREAIPDAVSILSFVFAQSRFQFVLSSKDIGFGNWKRARLFVSPISI